MFKKSKRNTIRQRTRQSDSEDETSEHYNNNKNNNGNSKRLTNDNNKLKSASVSANLYESSQSSESNSFKIQSKVSNDQPNLVKNTKLSFHTEEEDTDVFVVKKSAYSRRMERNKKKMLKNGDTSSSGETNGNCVIRENLQYKGKIYSILSLILL